MADTPDKEQQTEAPTAKRKADAARDGDVLVSKELSAGLMMLAALAWLILAGQWFMNAVQRLLARGLVIEPADIDRFEPTSMLADMLGHVAMPIASLFALSLIAAMAAPAILGSAGFRPKAFALKGSRINPLSGMKRIFGMQGLIELGKSITKVAVLGLAAYWAIGSRIPAIMGLGAAHPNAAAESFGSLFVWIIAILIGGLVFIAAIDVPAQFWQRSARLRMTKQQLKEEMRQSDGAPELKQAQRARQQEILSGSMRKAVTESAVILTNPTHFAVALRYRPGIDIAPVVVAKGRGDSALAIRALGAEFHVPSLEYPQLARAVYFSSRTGHIVSEDLFIAVAAILAFVFRLDRAMARECVMPQVDVPAAKRFDVDGRLSA